MAEYIVTARRTSLYTGSAAGSTIFRRESNDLLLCRLPDKETQLESFDIEMFSEGYWISNFSKKR
jgi:hypothetical protein